MPCPRPEKSPASREDNGSLRAFSQNPTPCPFKGFTEQRFTSEHGNHCLGFRVRFYCIREVRNGDPTSGAVVTPSLLSYAPRKFLRSAVAYLHEGYNNLGYIRGTPIFPKLPHACVVHDSYMHVPQKGFVAKRVCGKPNSSAATTRNGRPSLLPAEPF